MDRYSAHGDLIVEGYLGDQSGDLSQNNGTLQTDLNADLLDGNHESAFFNLSESETVTGRPAFNGGEPDSFSSFTVNSTYLVDNLNADMVDGRHGDDFVETDEDYGRYGVASELYEGTTLLGDIYVDEDGDSMANDYSGSVLSVVNSNDTTGIAIHAYSHGDTGTGVKGTAYGLSGCAVQGVATSTEDGTNYGGHFTSGGATGVGVYGEASNTAARANYGVYGKAAGSAFAAGVYGEATYLDDSCTYGGYFTAASGYGRGVHGEATGSEGRGVDGYATALDGTGGYFTAMGSSGRAVYGIASDDGDVENYGGYFQAEGSSARGVYGLVRKSGSVTNYGGYFESWGGQGIGAYGRAIGFSGKGVVGFGVSYDFYADGPGVNYGPFTGGHEVRLSDGFPGDVKPGMIVSVTGQTQIRREHGKICISSTLPTVKLSDTANDKAVLGAFVAETPLSEDHWYQAKPTERFATVNALGEGRVWVCDVNGEIEMGDYITTSSVPGYGQRQNDDLLRSCTLGKAIETVDWDAVTDTIEFDGQRYKVHLIGVVYTSG